MNKRVHLLGANFENKNGMEYFIKKAFDELGWKVICTSYRKMNRALVEMRIRNVTAIDFILCIKGDRISPESIYLAKVPTILFMQDSVQANQEVFNIIENRAWAYNKVYTFDPEEIPIYESLGIKASWLPLGYHPGKHIDDKPENQDIKIGFIGTLVPSREHLLSVILSKYPVQYNYSHDKYVEIINRTKINLNIGIISSGLQMRVFEILACGGFLMTNDIPESGKLFKDKEHLVYFNDKNLFELLDYYLEHEDERKEIGRKGRDEVIISHTYKHRVGQIIREIT